MPNCACCYVVDRRAERGKSICSRKLEVWRDTGNVEHLPNEHRNDRCDAVDTR